MGSTVVSGTSVRHFTEPVWEKAHHRGPAGSAEGLVLFCTCYKKPIFCKRLRRGPRRIIFPLGEGEARAVALIGNGPSIAKTRMHPPPVAEVTSSRVIDRSEPGLGERTSGAAREEC